MSARTTILNGVIDALRSLVDQEFASSTVHGVHHYNPDRAHPGNFSDPTPAILVRDTGVEDLLVQDDTDCRYAMVVLVGILVTDPSADRRLEIMNAIVEGIRTLIDTGITLSDDCLLRDGKQAVDYGPMDSFGVDDQPANTAMARMTLVIRYARQKGVA